jgi:hypothetical protein
VADWDQFDYAFQCPAGVDEDLTVGYEKMLASYRGECSGLDMSSSAVLRIASLCASYIRHLNTARRPYGDTAGYSTPAMEKNAWQAWLSAAKEHDEYVTRLRARVRDSGNLVPASAISDMVVTVLTRLTDPTLRAKLQDEFISEMEKAGI